MDENQRVLDVLSKHSKYVKSILNSFDENSQMNTFIFRKGNFWYRYENWDLPKSGIIREWVASNDDCIPKRGYTEQFSQKKSKIVFDLSNFVDKKASYDVEYVTLSTCNQFLLCIIKEEIEHKLMILEKDSGKLVDVINNISTETIPFVVNQEILFCRNDCYGRPHKLFHKIFKDREEKLLYVENNQAYRLRIIPSGSNNESCFVKTADFENGKLFLYSVKNNRLECCQIIEKLPKFFDVITIKNRLYFVTLMKEEKENLLFLKFISVYGNTNFEIKLKKNIKIKRLVCLHNNILLDLSNKENNTYILLKLMDNPSEDYWYKEVEIKFKNRVELYENSFSNSHILFLERKIFSETIFSFDIEHESLTKETCKKLLNSNFNKHYNSKTIWTSTNSLEPKIPITLLWKGDPNKGLPKHGKCVVYVYGAYGKKDNVEFDPVVLSIINAGYIYAVIHVRGGGFLGGEWYKSGRGLNKKNSIDDLIRGVIYLISSNIIDRNKIGLMASSAGGIIAGATLNEKRNLFKSMLLFSPFIDLYGTLIKGIDPLAKTETIEWGDISDEKVKKYIKSYSPFQNVIKAKNSNSVIISILGGNDYYINNNDVIQWSKKLNRLGVESYVYVNTGAGHGGFDSNDTELLAYFLNYFLEQIEK
ncbi:prolyl oligopeptidase [Streptococcus equinus]|uniref:prolyl oligopeptidase family serine peptidase n=1 Tax=Streptococcus equinus TaxID=1335 RepID=UPI00114450CE|nr:prolyl oligopeptidase family serine peptidase [Streptococcus equinus]GEB10391.1 prolyl oligopeptidase [Streptococcus equinus]